MWTWLNEIENVESACARARMRITGLNCLLFARTRRDVCILMQCAQTLDWNNTVGFIERMQRQSKKFHKLNIYIYSFVRASWPIFFSQTNNCLLYHTIPKCYLICVCLYFKRATGCCVAWWIAYRSRVRRPFQMCISYTYVLERKLCHTRGKYTYMNYGNSKSACAPTYTNNSHHQNWESR